MSTSSSKPQETPYYVAGTATRIEDEDKGWCQPCATSSMWVAPASLISSRGVTDWGTVVFCTQCKAHDWIDHDGKIHQMDMTPNKTKENNDQ